MDAPWVEMVEAPVQPGEEICTSCQLAVWSGLGWCPVCEFYGPPNERKGVLHADPDVDPPGSS